MNKYFLTSFLGLFLYNACLGQNLRKLIDYVPNPLIEQIYYNSDSLIYGNSYSSGQRTCYVLKGKRWELLDFKNGSMFTAPGSKVYFMDKTSFSIINPNTNKIEKTYNFNFCDRPKHFEVFKDSILIVQFNIDTALFQYNFDDKNIVKQTKLIKIQNSNILEFRVKLANDSILYFTYKGLLYKKNLRTDSLSILPLKVYQNNFDCRSNKLVSHSNSTTLNLSLNYGETLSVLNTATYGAKNLHLLENNINFISSTTDLISIDFGGNELQSIKLKSFLDNLTLFTSSIKPCDHTKTTAPPNWLSDSTWLMSTYDGDVYKIYPFQNKVKYLGGTFNLGLKQIIFNNKGNLVLMETGNGLLGTSSDTGKTFKIQEMSPQKPLKRAEFIGSTVFILNDNKLKTFNYNLNKFDTSFISQGLKINDFAVKDNQTLILFTSSGNYSFDIAGRTLNLLSNASPFENYVYLKKSNRFLALTSVDIYYSDDNGKNWNKSGLTGYDFFHTLAFNNGLRANEISKDNISLNAIFNDFKVMLTSKDGGQSFNVNQNNSGFDVKSMVELYGNIYSVNGDFTISKTDIISKKRIIDRYNDNCPYIEGMQAVDSGFFIWNSRAEVFYKKVPYKKTYAYSEKPFLFPNPVNSNATLNISIPKDYLGRISGIEIYDMLGKKLEHVSFEYSEEQNIYKVKNLPDKSPQFYVVLIKIKDGVPHREKVFIY